MLSLLEDDELLLATLRTPVNCCPEKGIGEGDIVGWLRWLRNVSVEVMLW